MRILILIILILSSLPISYAQNIWESTGGPDAGNITYVLAVSDTILLAGSQKSSLYKSTNLGKYWYQVRAGNNPYGNVGTSGMVVTSNNIIFATLYDGGLFKSIDLGNNWISLNKGPGFLYLTQDNDKLFLLTPREYIKDYFEYSTDLGNSWITVNLPDLIHQEQFATNENQNIWLLTSLSGVFVSADNGMNWELRNSGLATTRVHSILVNNNNETYIGTNNGVYYSTNFGIDWEYRGQGIPSSTRIYDIIELSDSVLVIGTAKGSFISYNNAISWYELSPLLNDHKIMSLCRFNDNVLIGSGNGPYVYTDSIAQRKCNGINEIIAINVINQIDNTLFSGSRLGLFYTTNSGADWNYNPEVPPLHFTDIEVDSPYVYLVAGASGNFWRSTDIGKTWTNLQTIGCCTELISFSNHYLSIGVYKQYSHAPPYTGIMSSTDLGNFWQIGALHYYYYILSFGLDMNEILFIGAEDLQYPGNFDLFISNNYGLTAYSSNTGLPNARINCIEIDSDNYVYLGTNLGIYISIDNGNSWDLFGMDSTIIYSIQFDELKNMYVRASNSVFKSTDGGLTFIEFNSGLENRSLSISLFLSTNNYLYIGTDEGVYKTLYPITTGVDQSVPNDQFPSKINLSQNYPNPFNPTTTISYQIPEVRFVTLKVYDVLGNEIAVLVNEEKPPGEYEVDFNSKNLVSGIYFYRLQAGSYVETKKMVLLR